MLLLALLVFLRLKGVHAGDAKGGCILSSGLPQDYVSTEASDVDDCLHICGTSSDNYTFTYWDPSPQTCYCSSAGPRFNSIQSSTDAYGTCATSRIQVYKLKTDYILSTCGYAPYGVQTTSAVADVAECLRFCKASFPDAWGSAAFFTPNPRNGVASPICQCSQSATGSQSTCSGVTTWYYWLRAHPVASAVAKRQQRMDKVAKRQSLGLCPAPMQACLVSKDSEQYECIDTTEELESCGGCMHGSPLLNASTRDTAPSLAGVDCTTLPGVVDSAVTCVKGECHANDCQQGWTLLSGSCFEN